MVIVGAGGHAICLIDLVQVHPACSLVGVVSDRPPEDDADLLGAEYLGSVDKLDDLVRAGGVDGVAIGIGDNFVRASVGERLRAAHPELAFPALVHPSASVAPSASVSDGAVVLANSMVGPLARLEEWSLLIGSCTLHHHSRLGPGASVGPGAHVGGDATIGDGAVVGLGASVTHGSVLGDHSVLGAGAMLHGELPDHVVAWGVPARVRRTRGRLDRYL